MAKFHRYSMKFTKDVATLSPTNIAANFSSEEAKAGVLRQWVGKFNDFQNNVVKIGKIH